jgi:hypothetical protein
MAIPEDQLTTWAQIGAQQTSKDTYATVKRCLDGGTYPRSTSSFLQGSYGNDTNIRTESDVDVVMVCSGIYYSDTSALPADQLANFNAAWTTADYDFRAFRTDCLNVLRARFGADVNPGAKAIAINASGNRRKADVLVCVEHHKYVEYRIGLPPRKIVGICFFKTDETKVVNYPRLHSEHLITKNQNTNEWFKHVVRIFKNARQRLISDGVIVAGVAPSYYIEGLLYNVPDPNFGTDYATSVLNCLRYLTQADRTTFVCANEQYRLLDGNADVTWNTPHCNAFINGMVNLWNQW